MATTSTTAARFIAVLAVGAASLVLAGCSLLPGGNGGGTVDTTDQEGDDVFSIEVGDCLNDADVSEEVSSVPIVECSEPHDSEAYFAQDMPDGDFPDDDTITAAAEDICGPAFTSFIGLDYEASIYDYFYYTPTEGSWGAGDREILCVAYADDASQMTGSIKGANK
jgi:hypothetical protein